MKKAEARALGIVNYEGSPCGKCGSTLRCSTNGNCVACRKIRVQPRPVPTEHSEQCIVVRWFDLSFSQLRGRLFAVPNGAHLAGTSAQRHNKMNRHKAEGLRVGVPDLWLPVARHGFHGLAIEMKRTTGSKTSAEQIEWLEFLGEQGYMAVLCKGADAAIDTIKSYLAGA